MKYTGEYTREIIFPLGGIGTGSIGLSGNGVLRDWEIFNRPAKGSYNGYSHFAVRAVRQDGTVVAKALCGDLTKDYMGQYGGKRFGGYGHGAEKRTMAGFPHFSEWSFEDRFPFATLCFSAPDFPASVKLTAFNPFIPMDEDHSGIPAAFFTVCLENTSDEPLTLGAALSLNRPFEGQNHATEDGRGVLLQSNAAADSVDYRDMTVLCVDGTVQLQPCWYRGAWKDAITTFWREFASGNELRPRTYDEAAADDTASVYSEARIPAGGSRSFRFLIAWNTPNAYNYWKPYREEEGLNTPWKNYYATLWQDSRASARYAAQNWDMLERRSRAFSDALYGSSLDPVAIEAAAANLCTLKSPTVLRLEDGTLWGWEGVHQQEGSCEGTCTHVWNYAYAMPFLFPRLERSMREADYRYNPLKDNGMMAFRIKLPVGSQKGHPTPCLDGQMGGIIKTYREWKLCGDTEWLRSLWPSVKAALEYAWVDDGEFSWDADRDGVLEGRQHHTLDMELFGPSAWLQGFYMAALKAAAEMAEELGYAEDAEIYRELFKKGSAFTEEQLFNGSYYIHKIDLSDRSMPERFGVADRYWNEEAGQIKYQIGEGSEIDQLCAQWHAVLCGLGDIFDPTHRRVALQSMYRNNFKPSMRNFANPWRVFVLNDEAGAVMCEYPEGAQKPIIPVPYCEECMSGFEYALGELMIAEGMEEEGMTLIRSIRERSDGKKRNPFNEIECGGNYARAMASWGLIPILSGFSYDMPRQRMGFAPRGDAEEFRSIWACGSAWGTVTMRADSCEVKIIEGELRLQVFDLAWADAAVRVLVDGKETDFSASSRSVLWSEPQTLSDSLRILR